VAGFGFSIQQPSVFLFVCFMMDDGYFPLVLFLLLLDESEHQVYLIPHTPLYPYTSFPWDKNRQIVLFMTIDTFFCLIVFCFFAAIPEVDTSVA
jgi:hypothetical protein